jgi:hypothetical protein
MADVCGCLCHDHHWAAFRLCRQEERFADAYDHRLASDRFKGVDVSHVTEAAIACDRCRDHHTAALSGPCYPLLTFWPTLPPRVPLVPLTPYVDGEGAES